jgi:hypothetical protein
MRTWVALLSLSLVATLGCSRSAEQPVEEVQAAVPWPQLEPYDMTETQKAQHELALGAVNALMVELMGELTAALDSGGPAGGIAVCRNQAPFIARRVSEQYGVDIGRTSFALRNPSNQPPPWAEPLVVERIDEPVFVAGPTGQFGALLPIRLKAECQMCHGQADEIADEVQAAIAEHYPQDDAIGFQSGDLRGWFWIEVPGEPVEGGENTL